MSDAVGAIADGAMLMIGGFMGVGSPRRLIDELVRQGKHGVTVIANDSARPGVGVGKLVGARLVRRLVTSHIGTNPETQRQMIAGELEVELVPQGTLAERTRAAGHGLGGVLTPTAVGTVVRDGKRTVEIEGKVSLLELPLRADIALINAWRADHVELAPGVELDSLLRATAGARSRQRNGTEVAWLCRPERQVSGHLVDRLEVADPDPSQAPSA